MSTRAVGRFLKDRGFKVRGSKKEPSLLTVDGEKVYVCSTSLRFEALWHCDYLIGIVDRSEHERTTAARYLVTNKNATAALVIDSSTSACWVTGKKDDQFSAPIACADLVRLDGNDAPPYTLDMLMKEWQTQPRKLHQAEAMFLKHRAAFGDFRAFARRLRDASAA
jgi:hypothetical protein